MRTLRAISAIFTASAGLDTEQTAPLHFFSAPVLEVNFSALRNQIEERLVIERVQPIKSHRNASLAETMTNDERRMTKE